MIRLRWNRIPEGTIELAGHSVSLASREFALWVRTRWFTIGVTYRRPAWIEVAGNAKARLAVRDHMMYARIVAVALPLAAVAKRLLDDE